MATSHHAPTDPQKEEAAEKEDKSQTLPKCGIIMPIAASDPISSCTAEHWAEVKSIIINAVSPFFKADLVSSADEVQVIQKTIIHNIYYNEIAVCDVSMKNPNVMFELGMRLAFDKPTVIIKDDQTSYTFDTGVIEHLEYPRDLRHGKIEAFKIKLAKKVNDTYLASKRKDYTTFLRHFDSYKVAQLGEKEVSGTEYISAEIKEIRDMLQPLIKDVLRREKNVSSLQVKNSSDENFSPYERLVTIPMLKAINDELHESLDAEAAIAIMLERSKRAFSNGNIPIDEERLERLCRHVVLPHIKQ